MRQHTICSEAKMFFVNISFYKWLSSGYTMGTKYRNATIHLYVQYYAPFTKEFDWDNICLSLNFNLTELQVFMKIFSRITRMTTSFFKKMKSALSFCIT